MAVENLSPEFPHSEKKKRRPNKRVIALIVVIIFVLLAIAGYFLNQYYVNKSTPRQIDIDGRTSIKLEPTLTPDEVIESVIFAATPEIAGGNHDKAISILKQAEGISTSNQKMTLYKLIAESYVAKQDKAHAQAYYDKALKALPGDDTIPAENRDSIKKELEGKKATL